jgi:hypothetical protein
MSDAHKAFLLRWWWGRDLTNFLPRLALKQVPPSTTFIGRVTGMSQCTWPRNIFLTYLFNSKCVYWTVSPLYVKEHFCKSEKAKKASFLDKLIFK